jgi:hypothetical protein
MALVIVDSALKLQSFIGIHIAVARMGEKRNVYRLLVGKPEGK